MPIQNNVLARLALRSPSRPLFPTLDSLRFEDTPGGLVKFNGIDILLGSTVRNFYVYTSGPPVSLNLSLKVIQKACPQLEVLCI